MELRGAASGVGHRALVSLGLFRLRLPLRFVTVLRSFAPRRLIASSAIPALLLVAAAEGGCVYFNAMYNAQHQFDRARAAEREGDPSAARIAYDSVIAKAGRVVANHPDSKYADDAALLKTRAELRRELWESAFASAAVARGLADDDRSRAIAFGLGGIAAFRMERAAEADSLLDRALGGEAEDLGARDRSTFHFWRGRARLALNRPDEATADLRLAVEQAGAGEDVDRLELAIALARVESWAESVGLTREILDRAGPGELDGGVHDHLDTLVVHAPERVAAMTAGLLDEGGAEASRRALLLLYHGRAVEAAGSRDSAAASYTAAYAAAPNTATGAEAALLAAGVRLAQAATPRDVARLMGWLEAAAVFGRDSTRIRGGELRNAAVLLGNLVEAFDSRGRAAAEALLRAAEVARYTLDAPSLARGLYLRYAEVAPNSRWVGKALYGALSLSPHRAAWVVEDGGAATDAELRERLRALPESDPYRAALVGSMVVASDSAFVRSERALRDRIDDIHGLFAAQATEPFEADTATADTGTVRDSVPTGRRAADLQ